MNGGRHVQGILRGFDPFMNLVMDDCLEMGPGGLQNGIGMVVSIRTGLQNETITIRIIHQSLPFNTFAVYLGIILFEEYCFILYDWQEG